MISWSNNITTSCTKQDKTKKDPKLGQVSDKTFGESTKFDLSKEKPREERSIKEDKYIYYKTEPAKSEANDTNEKDKMSLMMQK